MHNFISPFDRLLNPLINVTLDGFNEFVSIRHLGGDGATEPFYKSSADRITGFVETIRSVGLRLFFVPFPVFWLFK